jgi:chromosome segregation ATPase
VARAFDNSAVLLPGEERRSAQRAQPMRWGRFFIGFFYVLVTGCAIVLLGLSWRNEVDKRQAAEATAATSASSLSSAKEKLRALEDTNAKLSTRVEKLDAAATKAQATLDRRTRVLRDVRSVLRTTEEFVATLEGLDEAALSKPETRLGNHISALDKYLRRTSASKLDKAVLRARVRAVTKDLDLLRAVIATLTAGKDTLDKSVKPLGTTKDLDRELQMTLSRTKAALRR